MGGGLIGIYSFFRSVFSSCDHVTRASGPSKTILNGIVQGRRRRRARQRKKWTKNIAEWTGMSLATTRAFAHDRQRWRQLVQRSTVQRPHDPGKGSGIRDRDRDFSTTLEFDTQTGPLPPPQPPPPPPPPPTHTHTHKKGMLQCDNRWLLFLVYKSYVFSHPITCFHERVCFFSVVCLIVYLVFP